MTNKHMNKHIKNKIKQRTTNKETKTNNRPLYKLKTKTQNYINKQ